jgi:P-type conjugative transfer protein TrbG
MKRYVSIAFVASVLPAVAQQQAPPSQPTQSLSRQTVEQGPGPAEYDKAVQILQGASSSDVSPLARQKKSDGHRLSRGSTLGDAVELHREIVLMPNALLALHLSEVWVNAGPAPVAGSGGRVLFTYGQHLPTVVCAVLQVCELDLEAGEKLIQDSIDWGDHRFEVTPRIAGTGIGEFTYLVLKPTESGLDTTMTVGTNKRSYYVRLISTDHQHMAHIAFLYPDEDTAKRKAEQTAIQAEADRQRLEAEHLAQLSTTKPIRNWDYTVKLHGKDAGYLRPTEVGDDGVHTHVRLSEEARHRGLPVIEIRDARGPIPANARWDGNELVIDAVFERACLIEGVGREQQRACITNRGMNGAKTHGKD